MANDILVSSETSLVNGTSGNDTFMSPEGGFIAGQHTLVGGAGDDIYFVTSATKVVEQPGGGNDMIISQDSYQLPDNVETLVVKGNSAAFGNDGDNLIAGSPGNNTIDGGKGNDALQGYGGIDTFQFDAQSGNDTIFDWIGSDMIRLSGYSAFHSFADVKQQLSQVGSDVVLKLDAADSVTLKNTTVSSLTAANFQLLMDPAKLGTQTFDEEFNSLDARVGARANTGTWDLWGSNSSNLGDHTLVGNDEKEVYVDPNFAGTGTTALGINPYSIQDGNLVITAAPTPAADKSALWNYQYTSGAITTQHSFSQTYGYFEARMQLPSGQGAWPAFWLLPADGSWPPELDVLETFNNDDNAFGTAHTAQTGSHTMQNASTFVFNGDNQMHTYGVLWTPDTLTWYIDGVAVQSQPTPADMHSPMYMLMNLAVSDKVQDPNFTSQLKVDYIKAYSLADTGYTNTDASHPYWGAVAGVEDGFNWAYYAAHNPDVVAAGMNLLNHYETHGKAEGRLAYDPQSTYEGAISGQPDGFNAAYYLTHNPDVAASGMDALTHYEDYGKAEGRLPYDPTAAFVANPVTTITFADAPTASDQTTTSPTASTTADGTTGSTTASDGTSAVPVAANTDAASTSGSTVATSDGNASPVGTGTVATSTAAVTAGTTTSGTTAAAAAAAAATTTAAIVTTATTATTAAIATTTPVPVAAATTVDTHSYMGADPGMPGGFNADYYAAHNPDVVASGMDLLQHYLTYGKSEGRLAYDPSVVYSATNHAYWGAVASQPDGFNAVYYASHNPDVAASGMDLLYHYETYGKNEGRAAYDGAPGVTTGLTAAPVVATVATIAPATASAVDASASAPIVATSDTTAATPAVASATTTTTTASPITASPHAVAASDPHSYMGYDYGVQDGFNADYYLSHNPDVAASQFNPLDHYETHGKYEGRQAFDASVIPSATNHAYWGAVTTNTDGFNVEFYAAHNPDVVASGLDLFQHYETYGKSEGRLAYDDGSGKQDVIGTSGADLLVATGPVDKLMTGGGGADTFQITVGSGWNTITDFDVHQDKLDVSALVSKYGAPTITDLSALPNMSMLSGSEIHFSGGETVLLLGVTTADASHLITA